MGIGDGGSTGDAVCQVNGCSKCKMAYYNKTTNKPISLCEKHRNEYSQKGLMREMVSV
ncbi:MAG: hypothetical protein ACRD8W_14175 [Nitrososphaeraceae archaeon]